jgi:hypothetical protein
MNKRLSKFRGKVREFFRERAQILREGEQGEDGQSDGKWERTVTSTELPVRDMRNDVSRSAIEKIYHELLEPSFGPNELDTLDTLLDGLADDGSYKVWGLCVLDGDTPVGCILGYPYQQSGVLLIGYLVVNSRLRSQGAGSRLINEIRRQWFGNPEYPLVLSEVEDPRHHAVEGGSDPVRRAKLYARQGMQVVVGPYFQPKLEGEGRERVYNLFLTVVNESNDPATWRDSVPGKQIADFLIEYFQSSGEGEDWPRDDDEEGKQLLAFYQTRERIPLRPIGEWEHIEIPPPANSPAGSRSSSALRRSSAPAPSTNFPGPQ